MFILGFHVYERQMEIIVKGKHTHSEKLRKIWLKVGLHGCKQGFSLFDLVFDSTRPILQPDKHLDKHLIKF